MPASVSGQPSLSWIPSKSSAALGQASLPLGMPSLSMSGSQASPMPSPSVSFWSGFGVVGQLSVWFGTVSLSASLFGALITGWFSSWLLLVLGSLNELMAWATICMWYGPPCGQLTV